MINVITPFSFLNDDFKNGKIFPVFDVSFYNNISFGNMQIPFFIIFTEQNM